jgi:hypothetical protein
MQLSLLLPLVPSVASEADYFRERNLARAAEHLVCFDILRRGMTAFISAEGLPYDVVGDIGGLRRIQVKSTRVTQRPSNGYDYSVYRFKHGKGSGSLQKYVGETDLLAFVAMDRRLIMYTRPENIPGFEFRIYPSEMTEERCELSWSEAIRGW